jgi:hypothetical protein
MVNLRLDAYSMRARIGPVLVASAPVLSVVWYAPQIGVAVGALPVIFVVAMGLLAEQIARQLGKDLERRLAKSWGGLPTVRALRFVDSTNMQILAQRRDDVARMSAIRLPSKRDERTDPMGTDRVYDMAVRRALHEVRSRPTSALLREENIQYGFRRNLLALKPYALVLLVASLGLDAWFSHLSGDPASLVIFAALSAIYAGIWLIVVREGWLKAQAETFSDRFFLTVGSKT